MITVKDARKILGEKYKHLSDKDVQSMINFLYVLCERTIEQVVNKPKSRSLDLTNNEKR